MLLTVSIRNVPGPASLLGSRIRPAGEGSFLHFGSMIDLFSMVRENLC